MVNNEEIKRIGKTDWFLLKLQKVLQYNSPPEPVKHKLKEQTGSIIFMSVRPFGPQISVKDLGNISP